MLVKYLCKHGSIKQIYISSMQSVINDNDMLTHPLNYSFALRRNVRIKNSKLPPDFFAVPRSQIYVPSRIMSRQIGADISNRESRTPSFQCRKRETRLNKCSFDDQRKLQTARSSLQKLDNDGQLISNVLFSTNKLRKVIRKQSLDMKQKHSISIDERLLRLPKILIKVGQRH